MKVNLYRKIIFWVIFGLCSGTLWFFQYCITKNIPWWDDFHGLMTPLATMFGDFTIYEKFKALFSLSNEHRVVNDRIFMALIYIISGGFHLKALALLGYVNLVFIFILLFKVSRPYVSNILYLTPLIFIVFQAQYFESLQSLMVPFQNFSVILYSLLVFYFLIYTSKRNFLYASFFAIIAIFTHGNGILAFVIGTFILIFQKKHKKVFQWILISIITIGLYFWDYHRPSWSSDASFLYHLKDSILYTFEFLGSFSINVIELSTRFYDSKWRHILPQITGVVFTLAFLLIICNKYRFWQKNRVDYFNKLRNSKADFFLISSILFFIFTGIIIGITRTGYPIFSRYTLNSAFFIALVYLLILFNFKKNRWTVGIFSALTFINLILTYYNNIDKAFFNKQNLICDAINWQNNGTWLNLYDNPSHIKLLNPILIPFLKDSSYIFPKSKLQKAMLNLNSAVVKVANNLDIKIDNKVLYINSKCVSKYQLNEEEGVFFILKSKNNVFIFPSSFRTQNIYEFVKSGNYFKPEIYASYPLYKFPKDIFELYQISNFKDAIAINKTPYLLNTNKSEIIKN